MEHLKKTVISADSGNGAGSRILISTAITRRDILFSVCLVAAILIVYWQVNVHEFIGLDDDWYVTRNSHVVTGLTMENVKWAFTPSQAVNWHPIPLTWLSHMLDCQLFGLRSGWHHLTNVLLHIINSVLLLFILKKMTGSLCRSAFVSALFALHPLHVESVAWVAERKDVLSTLFWMLTMWAYVRYVQSSSRTRYLLVLGFLFLGLMAKPMLVSLPFVLLLMDYWPLGRLKAVEADISFRWKPRLYYLLWEKAPLFLFAGLVAFSTIFASGRRDSFPRYVPLDLRIANGVISYVDYLWKTILPFNLAVYYPFPDSIPGWKIAAGCFVLVIIMLLAAYGFKKFPYFAIGFLWYVATLFPVIGVIPVGSHAMADRYTYIPLIGIFIILAWGTPDILTRWRMRGRWFDALSIVYLFILSAIAWVQVGYWTDSPTLFEHALEVTDNNPVIHNNLSIVLLEKGDLEQALIHSLKASEIQPGWVDPLITASEAAGRLGRTDRAYELLLEVLSLDPNNVMAHNNLGSVAFMEGNIRNALGWWQKAEGMDSSNIQVLFNIALAFERLGETENAAVYYRRFLERSPSASEASQYAMSRIKKLNL